MVKAMGWILALAVIAVAVVYYAGGVASWDPGAKGAAAKEAITPGMTWTAVLAAAGEPGRIQSFTRQTRKVLGEEIEEVVPGAMRNFDAALFEGDFKAGQYKDGFLLHYVFTQQVAFIVHFDGAGNVETIEDMRTMADLLGTRK
jgi:hypothetical protein